MAKPNMEVRLRGGFSDRMGIKSENTEMQMDEFDERTRSALITATWTTFAHFKKNLYNDEAMNLFLAGVLSNIYAKETNIINWYSESNVIEMVCSTIRDDDYHAVLTVIEYLANKFDENDYRKLSGKYYNMVFEKEFVGYRFIGGNITPITDSNEMQEIQEAVSSPLTEVNEHLVKSLKLLSDRDNPDYSNSIKESIIAVERMCSQIIGEPTTLGIALKKLESYGLNIHPSMRIAFEKLYGYTSDASGIRHSGQLGGPDSTFEEAKFMLVACGAFINYLRGVLAKS